MGEHQFHNLVGAGGIYDESLFGIDTKYLPHYMVSLCDEIPDAWRDYLASRKYTSGVGCCCIAFPIYRVRVHTLILARRPDAARARG